jgi:RNA polymerase sigma-70 factor (ECF subfamily)
MTQAFFVMLLEGSVFRVADPERGRFRSFLLKSLQNFLTDQVRKAKTLKRGGGRQQLSLDFGDGEGRYAREPMDEMTPERIFERRWAMALIEQVMDQLRDEYERRSRSAEFESLRTHLSGDRERLPYARLAEQLGITEGAVRVAAHRMRRRYRELLRAEIARTVASPDEVDDELRHLMQCLGD